MSHKPNPLRIRVSLRGPLSFWAALGGALAISTTAAAQETDASGEPAAPGPIVVQVPSAPAPAAAPPENLDGHLPSSSQSSSDISSARDGFDLLPGAEGGGSVKGNPNGSFVVDGQFLPEAHTVRRGDTLWGISENYTQNAYNWPRVWALNPQIQNPHWIYPGDRVRLRSEAESGAPRGTVGTLGRGGKVPRETVFLREVGWIDNPREEIWGEIVGSPEEQMMLSDNNSIYAEMEDGHEVTIGQELSIFRLIRSVGNEGQLVSIRGTARVDRYNPKTHMVRAKVVEALDVIERGEKLGPIGRQFQVVPPVANDKDIEARILASVYPLQLYGQEQVLFLDKGKEDGLQPGNRLFAVRRGDPWEDAIDGAGPMAVKRPRVEDDEPAVVDTIRTESDDDTLPDETYAEIRVISVRPRSCVALVTASKMEVERGARLVARKGY